MTPKPTSPRRAPKPPTGPPRLPGHQPRCARVPRDSQGGLCAGGAAAALQQGGLALPRQAEQTAALGATGALRKPEPEPSPGRRRCRSCRRFPGRVGITERRVLMPRAAAAGPSLHPRLHPRLHPSLQPSLHPTGSRSRARAAPAGFGDSGMAGANSLCARPGCAETGTGGEGDSTQRSLLGSELHLLRPPSWGSRLGGADEAGPQPCTDRALHLPSVTTGTQGAPGMVGPLQDMLQVWCPVWTSPRPGPCTCVRREWGGQEGAGAYTAFPGQGSLSWGFPLNPQLLESGDSVRLNQSCVSIPSLCHGGCQGGESKGIPKITSFIQFFNFSAPLLPVNRYFLFSNCQQGSGRENDQGGCVSTSPGHGTSPGTDDEAAGEATAHGTQTAGKKFRQSVEGEDSKRTQIPVSAFQVQAWGKSTFSILIPSPLSRPTHIQGPCLDLTSPKDFRASQASRFGIFF